MPLHRRTVLAVPAVSGGAALGLSLLPALFGLSPLFASLSPYPLALSASWTPSPLSPLFTLSTPSTPDPPVPEEFRRRKGPRTFGSS